MDNLPALTSARLDLHITIVFDKGATHRETNSFHFPLLDATGLGAA